MLSGTTLVSGTQPRQPTARESGFHCMSPVVASRLCLGMPSASTVDPPPGSGAFPFRISRGKCDVQLKVIQCRLTAGQFAGTSDNFFRLHFQGGSQSKQGIHGWISQALLNKSHGLPVDTRLLSEQIHGNTALLPFGFQQTDDLQTDGFWHSIDWHTEANTKNMLDRGCYTCSISPEHLISPAEDWRGTE